MVEEATLERWYTRKGIVGSNPTFSAIKMYYTYILKSLKDSKFYYGSCSNLNERLKIHNKGKVRATKGRCPFVIHYFEQFSTRSEAVRREYFFKSIDGYNWLKKNSII